MNLSLVRVVGAVAVIDEWQPGEQHGHILFEFGCPILGRGEIGMPLSVWLGACFSNVRTMVVPRMWSGLI